MKKITKEVLVDASTRLMFKMSDEEYELLEQEFNIITKQLSLLGDLEGVDDVQPMTFPYLLPNSYLRDDEPEKTLSKEEVLKNAGSTKDGQIKLPKVV